MISKSGKQKYFMGRYMNLSHHIQSVCFGKHVPGGRNPLDDLYLVYKTNEMGIHEYFIKVVPTITDYFRIRNDSSLGVFFFYEPHLFEWNIENK
ncbi:Endoplasmic reticulum-Golgi intermediate compartment protein, putative [Galdieria sulphuraria]|uniref:Endoplasmic reticulum-Golgi intermediate compartment protein, putative n=1 Tax=Galdieria sulphuraria TaxID=130081 RepID=M2W157_GALSU|nr:Endoplasmic reticulum-Golgi intermediate compartment protein, putative [Galdieria sulphuraria]EME29361.1 Endoplasmic reticulum-Golgi intermediate compartment protein, putative [Galdieria sulphuraria]|eukprot:XP_005705881.1 Endoplasmic reticulum-Golgi intermediate compartment protein, putative [Galdieria sulphuraria]